jgi:hypothetical protein
MTPRPATLREVAEQSDSVTDFGYNVREWLHEIRRLSSRPQLVAAIAEEPASLGNRFPEGQIADAWLAAYAEHLASSIGRPAPDWTLQADRVADEPWFSSELRTAKLRELASIGSPPAFRRRNLFTPTVWLPLRLRRGRPAKSAEQKRKSNSERQRRFRVRRNAELRKLRELISAQGHFAPRM